MTDISFSLDSLDPQLQERFDGAKGTFKTRIDNLLWLAKHLPKTGVLPILNTVVTPQNFEELPALLDLADTIGFYSSFIPIHTSPENQSEHRFFSNPTEMHFSKNQTTGLGQIIDTLIQRKKAGARIINSTAFLKGTPKYLMTGRAPWPCLAGRLYLSISPAGKIAPCHAFEGKWEWDIENFQEQLASPSIQAELNQRIKDCDGCFRPCWTEVSFMMTRRQSLLEMIRIQWKKKQPRPKFDEIELRKTLTNG
jgi:MoaA/NifB/PqqE/SkfB family radical SAM enzyme